MTDNLNSTPADELENAKLGKTGEQLYRAYPIGSTPADAELRQQILDIIRHIDNPYHHFGLGVENEGYSKSSATDAIMQLFEAELVKARYEGAIDELERTKSKLMVMDFPVIGRATSNLKKMFDIQIVVIDERLAELKTALKDGAKGLE